MASVGSKMVKVGTAGAVLVMAASAAMASDGAAQLAALPLGGVGALALGGLGMMLVSSWKRSMVQPTSTINQGAEGETSAYSYPSGQDL